MSNTKDKSSVIIPLDILELISKKSKVKINDLFDYYIKGLMDSQIETSE